jgi:hypothetical protein
MKDPSWQSRVDYGRRMDYCCASTETMQQMLDDKRIPVQYWAQPKKGHWNAQTEKGFREKAGAPLLIGAEVFQKWNAVFHRMQQELEHEEVRNHSLGMFAITMTAELLKPETILLVGFDNLVNPMLLDYWKANRGKWTSQHDWLAEHAMLKMIEQQTQTRITPWA